MPRRKRHQNANGDDDEPKRCQDASGYEENVYAYAVIADCTAYPLPNLLRHSLPVSSSVELQMCQLSTF